MHPTLPPSRTALALGLAALITLLVPARAPALTQLAILVDASSSISASDYNIFRLGIAGGVAGLDADSTVELTLVQFGWRADVAIAPTLIDSVATRTALVSSISSMSQPSFCCNPLDSQPFTGTNFEDGIGVTTNLIELSPHFSSDPNVSIQFYNMLTDGNPTVDNPFVQDVEAGVFPPTLPLPEASAIAARDDAITAGVDIFSFEAIDPTAPDFAFLRDDLAYPQPGVEAFLASFPDPITSNGFAIQLGGFDEVEAALDAKFRAAEIPEPASGLLVGAALATLALLRRRIA